MEDSLWNRQFSHISDLCDLDLDLESGHKHTFIRHSSTSAYTPNWMDGRTDIETCFIGSTLGSGHKQLNQARSYWHKHKQKTSLAAFYAIKTGCNEGRTLLQSQLMRWSVSSLTATSLVAHCVQKTSWSSKTDYQKYHRHYSLLKTLNRETRWAYSTTLVAREPINYRSVKIGQTFRTPWNVKAVNGRVTINGRYCIIVSGFNSFMT